MALRVKVCRADEVAPGESRAFAVAGLDIPVLVINRGGRLCATTSMCPHEDVSLVDGEIGERSIICHGHGYEFDLETGLCSHDPGLRLRRYPVTVCDGDVYVDLVVAS